MFCLPQSSLRDQNWYIKMYWTLPVWGKRGVLDIQQWNIKSFLLYTFRDHSICLLNFIYFLNSALGIHCRQATAMVETQKWLYRLLSTTCPQQLSPQQFFPPLLSIIWVEMRVPLIVGLKQILNGQYLTFKINFTLFMKIMLLIFWCGIENDLQLPFCTRL